MVETKTLQEHLREQGIAEIPICAMDRQRFLLVGGDGRRYHEVKTNVWAEVGNESADTVYLGTGRHGGGIVLKPLFVRIDGRWINVTTGREAPVKML